LRYSRARDSFSPTKIPADSRHNHSMACRAESKPAANGDIDSAEPWKRAEPSLPERAGSEVGDTR
jgi:hypothetical protein